VAYDREEVRVDALGKRIDTTERDINGELYHIWTKKLHLSQLEDVKLVIGKKETEEENEDDPIEHLAPNGINVPTGHLIGSYSKQ